MERPASFLGVDVEGPVKCVTPVVKKTSPEKRERLFQCEHFWLWRVCGESAFPVGAADVPRVLVCIDGAGHVEHRGDRYAVGRGDVSLLPAVIGTCTFALAVR